MVQEARGGCRLGAASNNCSPGHTGAAPNARRSRAMAAGGPSSSVAADLVAPHSVALAHGVLAPQDSGRLTVARWHVLVDVVADC
jgi:hypothetical protein